MIKSVVDNLRFMVHEVGAQVEQTLQYFAEPSRTLVEKIISRDDYVDALKSLIQEKTFSLILGDSSVKKNDITFLRSVNTISSNLENIADFTVNMIRQAGHLSDVKFLQHFEYEVFFEEVLTGLERIEPAMDKRDVNVAFRICQCEFRLDELYAASFSRILTGFKEAGDPGDLITTLMMLHYLERMGDSLLNIGEAIIHTLIGENLKIKQYIGLKDSLSASGLETPISKVDFESIWGTRSGCRIGLVGEKEKDDKARPVLFKHGNIKKLSREKENIELWENLIPGLAPKVRGFVTSNDKEGSVLLEYLPGCTFQELIVNSYENLMKDALFMIEETLGHVWRETRKKETAGARFIEQIRGRMDSVYRIHPEFKTRSGKIGDLRILSFGELLRAADEVDHQLAAPFSVFIHGDLNANNIIYDSSRERIHFIDLHRSSHTDYVQDVSVFLVSIYRLPVFAQEHRGRLNFAIMDFFEFAKKFAATYEDQTFEARLALGLARSFFSSTRFELNYRFSKKMHMLSTYLLEKLVAHTGKPWEEFELPGETLVY